MVDSALLQQALRHVEQAAFALSADVTEQELALARAQLDEVRALLSAAAYQLAAPPPAGEVPDERDEDDDSPALVRRVALDGDLRAASAARAFTSLTCGTWGVPPATTSTVVDLASELVSNAARHAGGTVDLALERRGEHLVVVVADDSESPPRLLPYRRGVSEHGIGLRLVDQLSQSWGWHTVPEGKQVWARVALSETPARPARRVVAPRRTR